MDTCLVQDALSTWILEGLARDDSDSFALELGWFVMLNAEVLPHYPCSIVRVVAMLAEGDVLGILLQ